MPKKIKMPVLSISSLYLPPGTTPGELAAVSVGLSLIRKKKLPSDCFEEAIELMRQAARFLEARDPKLAPGELLSFATTPEGEIVISESREPTIEIRLSDLTFENLLKPIIDRDVSLTPTSIKKPRKHHTWFGSITTLKGLRKLIRDSGRADVLTPDESIKILSDQKMDTDQFLKLRKFQAEKHQNRGRRATASRQAKRQPPTGV